MIRKEIVLPAPREEVWAALTDPSELADWFANDVELDLRPGGGAHSAGETASERHATVTEVEPGERLAFEWDDEGEVEFTLDRRRRRHAADGRRDRHRRGRRRSTCRPRRSRMPDPFEPGLLARSPTRAAATCSATSPTTARRPRRS